MAEAARRPRAAAADPGAGPTAELLALRERVAELEAAEAERARTLRIQDALYRIADAASAVQDMAEFYPTIHRIVGELMFAENFYIALYDDERQAMNYPYMVDQVDTDIPDPMVWEPIGSGQARGLTAYVLRTGRPELIPGARWEELIEQGEIDRLGMAGEDWLGVPLVTEGRTVGVLVVQSYDTAHRYSRADVDLLAFVGQHVATALGRVRAVDETRQRNAELAVINGVQAGLAAQLDMQAMYDLVGDRIQEIFDAQVVDIAVVDGAAGLFRFPYTIERGVRFPDEPLPIGDPGSPAGIRRRVMTTLRPELINSGFASAMLEYGDAGILAGEAPKSVVFVPLVLAGEATGVISLQNLDREGAFSSADVRLLSTIAASLSVALENVRLIDETRRLLAETDQRAAELEILNGVQRGLAEQLDMQRMYDLVGDKVLEIFDAQGVDIEILDREANLIRFPYTVERGARLPDEPIEVMGFRRHVIETGEPLLIARDLSERAAEFGQPPIIEGELAKSVVFAPLLVGGETTGLIMIENLDREDAFDDGDVRFLTTLAASLSVALENARLIDETRRLLAEADQRAAELAIVNSVGQALSTHLDQDALIAHLGDQLVKTFAADIAYVALHDPETDLIEFPYYVEDGARAAQAPMPFGEGLTSRILRSREPLLLNQDAQFEAIGSRGVGTLASSYLGVPILVGDAAIGVISVQSTHQTGRFGESDTRLLSTLAANVGIAIQNARLYRAQEAGERQYRRLVEELPLVVYTDRPDDTSTSTYISPQVEAVFGYPREAWLDEPFFASVLHPDDRDRVRSQINLNFDDLNSRGRYLYRIIAADGRTVWVRDDAWIVRDEHGEPLHVQGFMMDVTEQTLAAAEIRRQKQYFEALVDISPVAIVTMDRDEVVSGWNPAATRLFGYQPDEAIGRQIDDLLFTPEGREQGQAAARLAAEAGRAQLIGRRHRKDGEPVDVEIVVVPLVIDDEHTGYYAIYHDITELEAARAAAEDASHAKSTFLAAMSHEIRTPMNAIIGMSGLLLDTQLSPEQRDFAETISTSGEALLTIINDILDFSKIEAGRIELEAAPFALRPTIEGALDVIAPLAAGKGIELAYAIDPDVPSVIVGDAGRLRQIVLNLLSNAVKFTERGEVVLRLTGRRLDAGPASLRGGRWELVAEVRDTGIGIPPERMDRLFQSFSQGDLSISRRFGGTGLGLAISRRLSELMDGSLVAESAGVDGEGSTFRLTIRVPSASELDLSPVRAGPLPELVGRRALVVDDNATNRQILAAQVARWGIVARDTASPLEALAWLEAGESFDVALLDLLMPELDGYALADRIRTTTAGAELPVIILSSVGARDREAGAVSAFLTKPVKPSALHDALMTALHGSGHAPSVRLSERPAADAELGARHPLRILLAEDNVVNQKVATRLLAQLGYTADIAANGLEAVAAVARQAYDLVLMDVQMPEMDGLEATRQIRAGEAATRGIRIVAMTANALAGDREMCLAAGMDDYVSKPIRPVELAAALAATPSEGARDA